MITVDPIAVRVVRRYVAHVVAERRAREVQRRPEGLVTVREENDEEQADGPSVVSLPWDPPAERS